LLIHLSKRRVVSLRKDCLALKEMKRAAMLPALFTPHLFALTPSPYAIPPSRASFKASSAAPRAPAVSPFGIT
jgi:hypothetical protein